MLVMLRRKRMVTLKLVKMEVNTIMNRVLLVNMKIESSN